MSDANQTSSTLYCANHPNVETTLRCNRCEKPICPKCAILTPTGYRCKECVRGQQKTFETAQWFDYPLVFIVAFVLSFLGSLLITRLPWLFAIFIIPGASIVISEVIRFVIQRRRARRLFQVAALAAAAGALPFVIVSLVSLAAGSLNSLWGLIMLAIYLISVPSTIYGRLHGINLR
jgi:hypothetical protein